MQRDFLRLKFLTDGDGTGGLYAETSCNGFAGHGYAWFSIPHLEEFAGLLLTYPLPSEGLAPLQGGYWSKERRGELDQLHLFLRFYPIGLRGAVGCKIELRTPVQRHDPAASYNSVAAELRTSYQALSEFSADLRRLVRGEAQEAVLHGASVG
jgi:hypothetical protein